MTTLGSIWKPVPLKRQFLEWDLYVTSVLSLLVLVAMISVSIELIPVIVLCAHPLENS